jgi:hypothetical protein
LSRELSQEGLVREQTESKLNLRFSSVRRALSMCAPATKTMEQIECTEGRNLCGFELSKCARICANQCDRRHGAASQDGRNSSCQHGSGARKKALFEPGDTKRQWKGEAAACFVNTGIASSRTLPTSSVGYWSPSTNLVQCKRLRSDVFLRG